jgi:hypothetical protein
VDDSKVREAAKQRQGVVEANVRDERCDAEGPGVCGDGREHREAVGCHPGRRVASGRPGEEQVVTLDDPGDTEGLEPLRGAGRIVSVVRPWTSPWQRRPELDHRVL